MVLRNVAKSYSLEEQRQEINLIAADLHALTGVVGQPETDPVFTSSDAYNITQAEIDSWNLTVSYGDHRSFGYATLADISNANNWNAAYGWGNHASVGYLTSVALNDLSDVDTTGATTGQAIIWDAPSNTWKPGTVATSGGGIELTDISVTTLSNGTASLVYDDSSGVFSFTPPDLSGFSTFSGSYNDLTNQPTLFSGSYNDLSDKPTFAVSDLTDVNNTSPSVGQILKWDGTQWSPAADLTASGNSGIALTDLSVNLLTSGISNLAYDNSTGVFSFTPPDLSGYSTFSGSYNDLTELPTLFSGNYTDLTNKPTIFSGSWNDLTDKPTIFSGSYNDLSDKPTIFSGSWNDLTDKPVLFSGSYNDLNNKPNIPSSLNDLVDVLISGTPNDGAILKYNATNSRWELGVDQQGSGGTTGGGGGGNVALGSIMMWSGSIADIPTGWQLCDGTNGTPDLRDRFVIGAGSNDYAVGTTGGYTDTTLPAHAHNWSGNTTANGNTNDQNLSHSHNVSGSGGTNNTGSHTHGWGANTFNGALGNAFEALDNPQNNAGGNKTANTNSQGSHSHNVSISGSTNNVLGNHSHNVSVSVSLSGNTSTQGQSVVGTNLPPYYALCFIYCTSGGTGTGSGSSNYIELDDLSVNVTASGTADLSYNNSTGLFTYTPPDLSGYLTSVSASDLGSISIDALSDVDTTTTAPNANDVLTWDGSKWAPAAPTGSSGSTGSGEIVVQDEGNPLSTPATTINFVGAGVVASGTGSTKTITISGGQSGSTYQWADGVEVSGWSASDLSDYMFNGSLNTFAKAETSGTDYLGWHNYANNSNLPALNGPVEIYVRYADVGNYTYEVNGSAVSPDLTGVDTNGDWITLTSDNVTSFRVTAPSTSVNVQIAGVKSNGLLLTPTALYGGTSGGSGSSTFIGLTDTPATFTSNKWIKVNSAGDGIEFVDAPSGGSSSSGGGECTSVYTYIGLEGWTNTHNAPILFTQALDDDTGGIDPSTNAGRQIPWLRDYVKDIKANAANAEVSHTEVANGGHNAFITDATLQAAIRNAVGSNAGSGTINNAQFPIIPTDGETHTINGTSYPVMGKLYVPVGLTDNQIDVVVVFHGTLLEGGNSTIGQAASDMLDRFVNTNTTNLNIRDKIIFSVAYPQDHIPQNRQFNLTGVGTEQADFLMGDNLPYARAAVGWVKNSLNAYIAAQGGSKTIKDVYLFGHSQGGKLVSKINTLETGIAGVIANAPGPIQFDQTCTAVPGGTSCSKVSAIYGTPEENCPSSSSSSSGGGNGNVGGNVFQGSIMLWSGSVASIPTGWQLCDGTNNSPDLRNKFIVGAASDNGIGVSFNSITGVLSGEYAPGNTGGSVAHQLTIDELAIHTHTEVGWSFQHTAANPGPGGAGTSSNNTSGQTGGDHFHENRPPYYALCYIYCTTNAVPSGIELTDLSVTVNAAGNPSLSYDNTTGVFSYTPPTTPDLSPYVTTGDLATTLSSYATTNALSTATQNASNWNAAYSWGNHATAGYLTSYTETQTLDNVLELGNTTSRDINTTGRIYYGNVFTNLSDLPSASSYHGMFAHVHVTGKGYFAHAGSWVPLANDSQLANVSDWDAAFSWGNHALEGYLGSSTVLSDLADVSFISASDGDVLTYNSTSNTWTSQAPGTSGIVEVIAGTGLEGGGSSSSEIDTVTLDISNTGVTGGTYANPDSITVNNQGQITAITAGSAPADAIPPGVIVMWSGSTSNVPSGWVLCDGTTYNTDGSPVNVPDLRGMFIVGSGGDYTTGDTGGQESVTLSVNELPSHSHTVDSHQHNIGSHTHNVGNHSHNVSGSGSSSTVGAGSHTHTYDAYGDGGSVWRPAVRFDGGGGVSYNTGSVGNHSHNFSVSISGSTNDTGPGQTGNASGASGTASPGTNSIGGSVGHENRPPYYALAYIYKLP